MKKILLPVIFLTSFLFSGCLNLPVFLGYFYEKYDFVNRKNKNVTIENRRGASPKLKLKNINFFFNFSKDFEKKGDKSNIYYEPLIFIYALEDKYIDHILINKVVVYVGEIEYSMLERVDHVFLDVIPYKSESSYRLKKEEIIDVQHTGLINHTISTDNENTPLNVQDVTIGFSSVPIDPKCKEVKILYDITVKYTTGEEIIINQEITGLKKKKLYFYELPIWALFFPGV